MMQLRVQLLSARIGQMQLEAADVLERGRVRRSLQERGEPAWQLRM